MTVVIDPAACPSVQALKWQNLDVLLISRPECQASVSLFGGQLLSFQPQGQQPVLWQNPNADFSGEAAIRAGIPICWPWFNSLTSHNPQAVQDSFPGENPPSHGLVRQQLWQVRECCETADATMLRLGTELTGYGLDLEVTYRFSEVVEIALKSQNLTTGSLSFCCALHSYFAISDIDLVSVAGLDGVTYLDMIDGFTAKTQTGEIQVASEVDRLYLKSPAALQLKDAGWQRVISLNAENSQSTVVWNPWIEKSQRLSQFLADDYRRMLCIETARANEDFVTLQAGESQVIKLQLSSQPQGA